MTEKEYVVYDFKKAGAVDDAANAFKIWINKSSQVLADYWSSLAHSEINLHANEIRTQSFELAIEQATPSCLGCLFEMDDSRVVSLCHIDQKNINRVVSELLAYPNEEELPDRPLTNIEFSLGKLFLETLARSLGDGWPNQKSLECKIDKIALNPKKLRLFRGKDLVTVTSITIGLARGDVVLHWILPKQEITELLESFTERRAGPRSQNSPQEVVDQLPIEIVGVLGEAKISMRGLSQLSVGDVVVLNQKIDQPIQAKIDGRTFYECWPGRIGNKQGLEITACF